MTDIYQGRNPADIPRYSFAEASRILDVPAATIRAWTLGRVLEGRADLRRIVVPAGPKRLSFTNLIELHVLRAMREAHGVPMEHVRDAIATLQVEGADPHPLATKAFLTDGRDLFLDALGERVKLSNSQQLSLHTMLDLHLERIERDEAGLARRLIPFLGPDRLVVVDPTIAFGRPVLAGTGIPIENLRERYDAGDTVEDLAADYGLDVGRVERVIPLAA